MKSQRLNCIHFNDLLKVTCVIFSQDFLKRYNTYKEPKVQENGINSVSEEIQSSNQKFRSLFIYIR